MGRLDGKVALISGGARGQGATEAKLFVREGAKVVLGDVRDEEGKKVEAEIRAAGGEATYVHLNVTSEADWRAAVDTAERRYGQLHVLVNNAGILIRKSIEETTEDDWDRIMAVNVKGSFWAQSAPFQPCGVPAVAPLSTSPRRRVWWGILMAPRRTRRPRAPYGSSPRRRRCSTPRTTSAATPCILAQLTLI